MTARTREQISTALDNHSGPLSSEIFEDFLDSREFSLVHTCNLSTDIDEYIVFPYAGTVREIHTVINATIATGNETIVFKNGADALGTITVHYSGSQPGDVDELTPTANNVFTAGEAMLIEIGGESTNAPQCDITIVYQLS